MKFKDIKGYLIAIDLDGTLVQNFDDYDKKSFELLLLERKLKISVYNRVCYRNIRQK